MIDIKHLSDNQFRAAWELALTTNEVESSFAEGRIAAALYEIIGCDRSVDREEIQKAIYFEHAFRQFNEKNTGFVFIKAFGDWDYLGGFIDNKEKFMRLMERIHDSIMARQQKAIVGPTLGLVGEHADERQEPEIVGTLDQLKERHET